MRPGDAPPGMRIKPQYDRTVLVLQGGGAMGAYQAGVFEGLVETGYVPDWVVGVSIGAINAALIAGNTAAHRVQRLREFWDTVSSAVPVSVPVYFPPLHSLFNRTSAALSAVFGVPGFYTPRVPPPTLLPDGHPDASSFYDTRPLRQTLEHLVNFTIIKQKHMRLSMGAVNVATGNSQYFDNGHDHIGPEHVMASGALPPAFGPVKVGNDYFWDGGIVSNSPLSQVLDEEPHLKGLVIQIDLFSASGALPANIDQTMERQKDIMYSSKTRFNTRRILEEEELRSTVQRVLKKLPAELGSDEDVALLKSLTAGAQVDIVHLINRRYAYTLASKDNDFSRGTVDELWEAGLADARRTFATTEWGAGEAWGDGIRVFDIAQ
jgi:NTE family protein